MRLIGIVSALVLSGCASVGQGTSAPLALSSEHPAAGQSGQALCQKARDWAAWNFKDAQAVLSADKTQLKTQGTMTVPGYIKPYPVTFSMSVACQDGRATASYDNFQIHNQGQASPVVEDGMSRMQSKSEALVRQLDAQLRAHLAS